jgi:hypothetical protein
MPKMDNLMELAKIFGVSVNELTNTNINATGKHSQYSSAKQREYLKVKNTFSKGVAFATMLIILGMAAMMFCINGSESMTRKGEFIQQCEREKSNYIDRSECVAERLSELGPDSAVVTGVIIFLASIVLALPFYIILGIQLSTIKKETSKEERAVPDNIKAKINRNFPLQVAIGVCLIAIGAAGIIVLYGLKLVSAFSTTMPIVAFLILTAIAIFLFIYAGIQKSSTTEIDYEELYGKMTEKQKKNDELIGRLCGGTMLLAVGVYVCCGFFINSWSWLWPVFPIGVILCAIFGAVFSSSDQPFNK